MVGMCQHLVAQLQTSVFSLSRLASAISCLQILPWEHFVVQQPLQMVGGLIEIRSRWDRRCPARPTGADRCETGLRGPARYYTRKGQKEEEEDVDELWKCKGLWHRGSSMTGRWASEHGRG